MTKDKIVIALGFFDGVHIGHAALLEKTKERAKRKTIEITASFFIFSSESQNFIHENYMIFSQILDYYLHNLTFLCKQKQFK